MVFTSGLSRLGHLTVYLQVHIPQPMIVNEHIRQIADDHQQHSRQHQQHDLQRFFTKRASLFTKVHASIIIEVRTFGKRFFVKRFAIRFNAPVVLSFAILSLLVLVLDSATGGASTARLFCVYRAP